MTGHQVTTGYAGRLEVLTCRVRANRKAAPFLNTGSEVAVCPWELEDDEAFEP